MSIYIKLAYITPFSHSTCHNKKQEKDHVSSDGSTSLTPCALMCNPSTFIKMQSDKLTTWLVNDAHLGTFQHGHNIKQTMLHDSLRETLYYSHTMTFTVSRILLVLQGLGQRVHDVQLF